MDHPELEHGGNHKHFQPGLGQRRLLHGYVLKSDGTSLSGVKVQVLKGRAIKGKATTDRGGYWEILDLAEGTYKITASMAGYVSQIKRATIGASTATKVTFTLTREHSRTFKNKRKNVDGGSGAF
jgi:hypothetical protein